MPDEKISAMVDIGAMTGAEKLPLVKTPTDGVNYSVALSALVAFVSGTLVHPMAADTRTAPQTIPLPAGSFSLLPIVFDQYGNAQANNITITGAAFPLSIRQNNGSVPFFWTGTVWFPF